MQEAFLLGKPHPHPHPRPHPHPHPLTGQEKGARTAGKGGGEGGTLSRSISAELPWQEKKNEEGRARMKSRATEPRRLAHHECEGAVEGGNSHLLSSSMRLCFLFAFVFASRVFSPPLACVCVFVFVFLLSLFWGLSLSWLPFVRVDIRAFCLRPKQSA